MKPLLHYHSDCIGFLGCENMVANFLNDKGLRELFEVTFTYCRDNEYERGLRARVSDLAGTTSLPLLDPARRIRRIQRRWVRRIAWFLAEILVPRPLCLLWNTVILYRFLRNRPISILHINNGGYPASSSCRAAAIAARLAKITTVLMVVNNQAESYSSPLRWLDYPIDRLVRRSVTVFVTGSQMTTAALRAVLRTPSVMHRVIPNGIAGRLIVETPSVLRRRLGVREGVPTIGVVARLEKRKGHIVLLQALAYGKSKGLFPTMPVTLIEGVGEELATLEAYAASVGLDRDVIFCGAEMHVFDLLNAVTIVALPSISHEDMPNVVIEAMSLGKPVIASRVGGVGEQINHLESGFLVTPGAVEELSLGLNRLLRDEELLALLGANARKRFASHFTVEAAVSAYVELYTSLVQPKVRPHVLSLCL